MILGYTDTLTFTGETRLDTITMKCAETDKKGKAMEKAFLEISKSFSFYIISQKIELYPSTIPGHFTSHLLLYMAKQFTNSQCDHLPPLAW